MDDAAKLLTAAAALTGAVAWPLALIAFFYIFGAELGDILRKIPILLDRLQKGSFAGISIELQQVAAETEKAAKNGGQITSREVEAAARIKVQAREVEPQALLDELDRLCLEYDGIRRSMPPGRNRTEAMTRVIVKMRSLAPSVVGALDVYRGSGSAGSRLAAVAMMQMVPSMTDLDWLKERFSVEHPFVFYHAALALQIYANAADTPEKKQRLQEVTAQALATIKAFKHPDQNTVQVLEMLLSTLRE